MSLDRTVRVRIRADIGDFKRQLGEVSKTVGETAKATEAASSRSIKATEETAKATESAASRHKGAMLGFGLAAVAGVGVAVKKFADFDKAMSSVRAATHETTGNMGLLRAAAVKAGADTAFSAEEAARGIEEMAKAGVSTAAILSGGLDGALALAAAGSLDVGEAAEIAASAMTQFKLEGKDIPHIADLLAAGAGKAQGSVQDMGAALNQAGLIAAQTGLTIEEATGGLAAFASAGLTGSDAGTSFKTMLQSMVPNSEKAAKAMDDLGISAYDSQGNFVGLSEYAGNLQSALSTLTDEQRNSTLKTIFGSDAIRAAAVLYEQGAEGIQKWEAAVSEAGYAAETAAIMQDNLAGDIEKLGGAMDTVFLKSGSGANEFLRGLTQNAEDLLDRIGEIPEPVLSAGAVIAGLAGVSSLAVGGLLTVIPKIHETRQAMNDLAPAGSRARGALAGVAKAAGAMAALTAATSVLANLAQSAYMDQIDTGMGKVAKAMALTAANAPGAASALDTVFQDRSGGDLIRDVTSFETAMDRMFNKSWDEEFNDWGSGLINGFLPHVKGSTQILEDSFSRLDDQLAEMVSSGNAAGAENAFLKLSMRAQEQGISVGELRGKFSGYEDAMAAAAAEQTNTASEAKELKGSIAGVVGAAGAAVEVTEEMAESLDEVGLSADGAIVSVDRFMDSLLRAGDTELAARDAARGYQSALDALTESVTENGTTLDITTDKGRDNQAAFDAIASAGTKSARAIAENSGSQKQVQGALSQTYKDLIAAAGQFGITGKKAQDLARDVLGIPPGVSVTSWMSDQAKKTAENTKGAIDQIPRQVNVSVFADADISAALGKLDYLRANSMIRANAYASGNAYQKPAGKATGGAITGPGTGTSDEVPLLASNGEHMWTAREVKAAGGHGAMYRMRAAVLSGQVEKRATGGAIGAARERELYWARQVKRYTPAQDITALDRAQAAYEEARDRREKLQQQAAARRETMIGRASRMADMRRELSVDLRRGQVGADLTTVDRMFDMSRQTADFGRGRRANLSAVAYSSEQALTRLGKRADLTAARLENARNKFTDLMQVKDSVAGKLGGEFSLAGVMAAKSRDLNGPATAADYIAGSRASLGRVQLFGTKLGKLQKMGYSSAIIREIADMGSADGMRAADALLAGTAGQVRALNFNYRGIDAASQRAGEYVTASMYKGGVDAAEGLVQGLASQQKNIEAQMLLIGRGMEKALKQALGIRSPSKVARDIADNFGGTLNTGLGSHRGPVAKTSRDLGLTMATGTGYGTSAGGQAAGGRGGADTALLEIISAAVRTQRPITVNEASNPYATATAVARLQMGP